jgi:hypothetical protein
MSSSRPNPPAIELHDRNAIIQIARCHNRGIAPQWTIVNSRAASPVALRIGEQGLSGVAQKARGQQSCSERFYPRNVIRKRKRREGPIDERRSVAGQRHQESWSWLRRSRPSNGWFGRRSFPGFSQTLARLAEWSVDAVSGPAGTHAIVAWDRARYFTGPGPHELTQPDRTGPA